MRNNVIATTKLWHEILVHRLTDKTNHNFHLLTHKEDLNIEALDELNPRYIFFPHWSYMVPEDVYNKYECIIFHMTDLPYGRGGSPLQNLIIRGHKDTKLSALRCVSDLDAGPIYLKRSLSLEGSASEIFLRSVDLIESMIVRIIETNPKPKNQSGKVTRFNRRQPSESNLFNADVSDIESVFDFIRMLDADGYPKAFIDLHRYRIEFSRVQHEPDKLVGTFVIYQSN